MARSAVEPVDLHRSRCRINLLGYLRVVYDCAVTDAIGNTLVSRVLLIPPRAAQLTSIRRLFPYGVTVSAIALVFLLIILILAAQRLLIPGLILLGSFILFVLWLTMLIETAIQLYGPAANVNGNCQQYVQRQAFTGVSVETVQYLAQLNICNCWRAAFSFSVVGTVLFLYMMVLAWQVQRDDFD
jgi:hypothetical protein